MNKIADKYVCFPLLAKTCLVLAYMVFLSIPLLLQWGGKVDGKSMISLLSLAWFIILVTLACKSEKYYWTLAPLAILFTPNAINGVMPGSEMGPATNNPSFSFITHVDIYLLLGVVLYCKFLRRVKPIYLSFVIAVALCYLMLLLTAVVKEKTVTFWFASFQLRYLFMLLLLFTFANPQDNIKRFCGSLLITAFLIFIEAAVFSFIKDAVRLTSGNYGVNLLGHFFAAMTVFTYCYYRAMESRATLSLIGMAAFFVAFVFLTGTRFSLLILLVGFGVIIYIEKKSVVRKFSLITLLLIALVLFFTYIPTGLSIRGGLIQVWEGIRSGGALTITEDSSSMITRLMLWLSTIRMILDNLLLGVSPGEWPFLKETYNIPFDTVLDPHNEILNIYVNYGLVSGTVYFSIVYAFPLLKGLRIGARVEAVFPWFALLVVFFLAGLSNSVTWKHQFAFLIPYAALTILFYKGEVVRGYIEK